MSKKFDVIKNFENFWKRRSCLVTKKYYKIFPISRHIESYGTYIEH